jgi:hypothetical protein
MRHHCCPTLLCTGGFCLSLFVRLWKGMFCVPHCFVCRARQVEEVHRRAPCGRGRCRCLLVVLCGCTVVAYGHCGGYTCDQSCVRRSCTFCAYVLHNAESGRRFCSCGKQCVAEMCGMDHYFVMVALLSVALCTCCVLATACGQIIACCIVSVLAVFVACFCRQLPQLLLSLVICCRQAESLCKEVTRYKL